MKMFEELNEYLEKVQTCLRCGQDLKDAPVKYKTNPERKCPRCGLIIELSTTRNRLKMLVISASVLFGILGFLLGIAL